MRYVRKSTAVVALALITTHLHQTDTELLRSFFGVAFVSHSSAENYNPPLWTMFYEFLGSFMVFAILVILRASRPRTWILGVLFIVLTFYEPFLALFVAGILIADLYGQIESSQSRDLAGAILCTWDSS